MAVTIYSYINLFVSEGMGLVEDEKGNIYSTATRVFYPPYKTSPFSHACFSYKTIK
jgi:hypothetical protein